MMAKAGDATDAAGLTREPGARATQGTTRRGSIRTTQSPVIMSLT